MYTSYIELCEKHTTKDQYNQKVNTVSPVMSCYAERTEFGGRENLYASRIVHENQVVYSMRWRPGVKPTMYVYDDGIVLKIKSVHTEGRRLKIHITAEKSDAQEVVYVKLSD